MLLVLIDMGLVGIGSFRTRSLKKYI